MQAKGVSDMTVKSKRQRIFRLKEALGRLWRDDYGYCTHCGEEIGMKRLSAVPESAACMECIRENS